MKNLSDEELADQRAAYAAYARAIAWARSASGTPYGGTEVEPDTSRMGTIPELSYQLNGARRLK